ncbi:hypothetical protein VTL71DRAFT_7219 [Oculimacula yallundae]|uniref:Uncharacterized protein n=1 Tax=Oculimacula yallundae TaxID=86028 RepID=A0ABR4BW57_9HELO
MTRYAAVVGFHPQHASYFSYTLARPYPFKWFTWFVVIGEIIFTLLFSALNLAANGYLLKAIYTTNPNATLEADHWYKHAPWFWTIATLYSLVLLDLGQEQGANAFTDPVVLQYLLKKESNINLGAGTLQIGKLKGSPNRRQPVGEAYTFFADKVGTLGTRPATIYQQYACSIPEMKDVGSLIVTIIVADLVLLNALFDLLKLGTTYWVGTKEQESNNCAGCNKNRCLHGAETTGVVGQGDTLPKVPYEHTEDQVTPSKRTSTV